MEFEIQRVLNIDEGGQEFVYLYFYPTYRDIAYMNDVTQWPCKIGRTDQNPLDRIRQQLNSCAPETPEVGLIVRCNDSNNLETIIHRYMKMHNRFLNHEFNKEWFNTNPDEVYSIIRTFMMSPEDVWIHGRIRDVDEF